jgi:hypothetical protein
MKLKLTPQRLAANRANCKAGGLAYAEKEKNCMSLIQLFVPSAV